MGGRGRPGGAARRGCIQGYWGPPQHAGTRHGPGWGITVRLSPQLSVYKLPEPCVSLK